MRVIRCHWAGLLIVGLGAKQPTPWNAGSGDWPRETDVRTIVRRLASDLQTSTNPTAPPEVNGLACIAVSRRGKDLPNLDSESISTALLKAGS